MHELDMIKERVETLRREIGYLQKFAEVTRASTSLHTNFGFIFRCSSGPFHIEEFMLEDFSTNGETRLLARRDTALMLDDPMVWFPSPEIAAHVVETLKFDFPAPLIRIFMRTPIREIQVRINERCRQIATLNQILKPCRN